MALASYIVEYEPGLTGDEYAWAYHVSGEELAEALWLGLIERGESRVCQITGTRAVTYVPRTTGASSRRTAARESKASAASVV